LRCEGGSTSSDGGIGIPGFCTPGDPTSCPGGCCDGDVSSGFGTCVVGGDTCMLTSFQSFDFPFGCGYAYAFTNGSISCTCNATTNVCDTPF
jgi:hypothetical protein